MAYGLGAQNRLGGGATKTQTQTQIRARPLSARHQWAGRVRPLNVERDGELAEAVLECDGREVVAVITRASVKRLGLREGESAYAVVKAMDVMIGR